MRTTTIFKASPEISINRLPMRTTDQFLTEFSNLPEGCVAHVISLTTPRDACRCTTIARLIRSAADSDAVWDKFLPADYTAVLAQSDAADVPQLLAIPKKQLFMSLCDQPVLIDGGSKSFFLAKSSGKKCYMIAARGLNIVWGDTPEYWKWVNLPESRFAEVAVLRTVCWLHISGRIDTCSLSPKTTYASYLVYKLRDEHFGLDHAPSKASVEKTGFEKTTRNVYLDPEGRTRQHQQRRSRFFYIFGHAESSEEPNAEYPKQRPDGWLEVKLGEYVVDDEAVELEMTLQEVENGNWKRGLVVQGIEVRPTV